METLKSSLSKIYHTVRTQIGYIKYVGNDVQCPICNKKAKLFLPYGNPPRNNVKCIKCGSFERDRLLWLFLLNENKLPAQDKKRILHFAPEEIFYNILSTNSAYDYYPSDLTPERYKYKGNVSVKKADITDIPFDDNSFDIVLCNHVLEHIPDDAKAMRELHRVLNDKGWGIFQVPIDQNLKNTYEDFSITDPQEREKAFGLSDHVRIYGRDYADRLENAGFKVSPINYCSKLKPKDILKYGLMEDELIYYCTK